MKSWPSTIAAFLVLVLAWPTGVGAVQGLAAVEAAASIPVPPYAAIEQSIRFYDGQTYADKGGFVLKTPKRGLSMALADFGVDNRDEIVMGAGVGEAPDAIFLRTDGSELKRFLVYGAGYRGGVNVAVGDIDQDSRPDIVTAPRQGGGPHVRVFAFRGEVISEWFAYDAASSAGVTIAAGNVDKRHDGDEVVTAPGEGQPALLRVYTGRGKLLNEWYPFGQEFTGGLRLSVAPNGWILASRAVGGSPLVRAYDASGALQTEFMAYHDQFGGGVQTAAAGSDKEINIWTVPGLSGGPHVRRFDQDGTALNSGFMALDGKTTAGLTLAAGDIDADNQTDLAVAVYDIPAGPTSTAKSILVDLSEQRLWTFERGQPIKSYLISSGTRKFPTPVGTYAVTLKREKTRMSWYYGAGNPNNYDLPNVPWVMTFKAPFNIHGTYWHNNFGRPMSHGCINMSTPDSKEVYDWAEIGTAVVIQY